MPDQSETPATGVPANGNNLRVFLRDNKEFLSLPLKYRWEFTRRHPYYLRFWKWANKANPDKVPAGIQRAALDFLYAVNVVQDPPDPILEYEELESPPSGSAFEGGALAPVTARMCTALLCESLSSQGLFHVARMLCDIGRALDQDDQDTKRRIIREIPQFPLPELDQIPNPGAFSFWPRASTNAIVEAVRLHVEKVKRDYGIEESRRREEKLPTYRTVWDMREAWTGDGYDPNQEATFKKIAQHLKVPVSTVVDRYKSAFKLITGHDYHPDVWWELFGPLKLPSMGVVCPPRGSRHPLTSRVQRPVPSSTLGIAGDQLFQNLGVDDTDFELRDLVLDIQEQIASGRSVDEIAKTLRCCNGDARMVIDYVRKRSS